MAAKPSGVCEKLRTHLNSLCCESAIVTLALVSTLAITGEILVNYGVLTAPSSQEGSQGNESQSPSPEDRADRDKVMDIVEAVFHYISLTIALIFFIEMAVKLAVFRMTMLADPWQILDMLVVLVAALVEVVFEIEGRMIELEACTYVVVFRLWRIPYDCNIKAKAVQHDLEQDLEVWKAGKIKMEEKCRSMEAKITKHKEKAERLERELQALQKERKEVTHRTKPPSDVGTRQVPNGSVPRDIVDGVSSNHSLTNRATDDEAARAPGDKVDSAAWHYDADSVSGLQGGRAGEEEKGGLGPEDTTGAVRNNHFRSGSESSLSCQALEHEVSVEIEEEEAGAGHEGALPHSEEGGSSALNTPILERRVVRRRGEQDVVYTERGQAVYYDNVGYNPDDADDDHGVLMHEFDGTKTYKSAEGIPMTDL